MRPIAFEHTAWDLALSTQAMAHIAPDLAYDISRIYTHQASFQTYENSFIAAMLAPGALSGEGIRRTHSQNQCRARTDHALNPLDL
jgi:hypothetical protein